MTGPWVLFLGSPAKLVLALSNRFLTWTGLAVLWKKLKRSPDRIRRFLVWGFMINAISLAVLIGLLRFVRTH